jgi:hypothetical protein
MHRRAARELAVLFSQSYADPEPSQRYAPDAHFAWAQRESRRQAQRRKLEEYLP